MARPQPYRLIQAGYPWTLDVLPRFGDMDALRHLNNVALARIYEDARARFQHGIGTHDALPPRHGFLVAEVAIQYLAEGHYPDAMVAACGIDAVGRSSFAIAQALFQRGRCIGTADVTLVHVDRADARPVPLPDAARAILSAHRVEAAAFPADTHADTHKEQPAHA